MRRPREFLGSSCIYPAAVLSRFGRSTCYQALSSAESAVCDREDRRYRDLLGLQPPVLGRFLAANADEALWAGRQLQPRDLTCTSGPDPQDPRGEARAALRRHYLGNRTTTARV